MTNDQELNTSTTQNNIEPEVAYFVSSRVTVEELRRMLENEAPVQDSSMQDSPLQGTLVLANKRTIQEILVNPWVSSSDYKIPLLKKAKYYREQTVKDMVRTLNETVDHLKGTMESMPSENKELKTTMESLQEEVKTLKENNEDHKKKLNFLEDSISIHNQYTHTRINKTVSESVDERKALRTVLDVLDKHKNNYGGARYRLDIFFARLQEALILTLLPNSLTTRTDVDLEAKKYLAAVGARSSDSYDRDTFAKSMVKHLFSSSYEPAYDQ